MTKQKVLIIGSGAWGTALANLLAKNSHEVFLNARDPKIVAEINQKNSNQKFLPNIKLNSRIKAVIDFDGEINSADFVFIVTPSSSAMQVFEKISKLKIPKNCKFVICSKGVEPKSLLLLSDAFEKITGLKNYAVLSGPNFAIEVANEVPTITTIATKNKKLGAEIIKILNNNHFRASYCADPRSVEICGIVKNIIAIGCGIAEGLGLGVNAKAALVMKGISEIQTLCKKLGASVDIANAAGFGDIFLTCSSEKSRNNSLGKLIAAGGKAGGMAGKKPEIGKTYEGATSAHAIAAIAKKLKLKLDLCEGINEILTKKFSQKEIEKRIVTAVLQ